MDNYSYFPNSDSGYWSGDHTIKFVNITSTSTSTATQITHIHDAAASVNWTLLQLAMQQ